MYIGIDIGGSNIRVGLLNDMFEITDILETTTPTTKGKKGVIQSVVEVCREFPLSKVKGIGIAIRGQVDFEKGVVIESTMMPGKFRNVHLASEIKKALNKRVVVENDTNCFTYAEAIAGAGKGKRSVVGITLGTGIGSGIVINETMYRGAYGGAAEMGHMIIDPNQYKWNTGKRGPFEGLCSGTAMKKLYYQKTKKKLSAFAIEDLYQRKDKNARAVIKEMTQYLAIGLANVIHILNPDVIVIGGGVSRARFYVDGAVKQLPKHLVYPAHRKTKVVYAKLDQYAGLIGAAMLAQNKK